MSHILFDIIAISLFGCVVTGTNDVQNEADRRAHSNKVPLWFGPRLGKREPKLFSEDDRQSFFRLLEAADTLKLYYDRLPYYVKQVDEPTKVTKKIVFTPKLGRSVSDALQEKQMYDLEFTPRLGRRVSEDMPATPPDQEYTMYRPEPAQTDTRTRYFSPRLGRTMNFSPRLGRELDYDVQVARSINKASVN